MAERGGRRKQTWGAPVSWREASALEAARAVSSARNGVISRADWLLEMAEPLLRQAVGDQSLPSYVRQRAAQALASLESERAEIAAHPPRPGRPPSV